MAGSVDVLFAVLDSPERRLLHSSVCDLLDEAIPPDRALALDAAGEFDALTWSALARSGLLGLGVSEEAGGSGGGVAESLIVTLEIARRLPSLAVDYVLCGMNARLLADHGTTEQLAWFTEMTGGQSICAYGLSEPGGGTDLLSLTTRAVPTDDGRWLVTGAKQWISLAGEAKRIFVLARTDPQPEGRSRAHGLSLIAVPTDQQGVTTSRIWLSSMRAAGSYDVYLDEAVSDADGLIGPRGSGFMLLRETLDVERILSAGISLGLAAAALDLTVSYAQIRHAFGGPIGRFQNIQHAAADSLTELTGAALLTDHAVAAVEQRRPDASRASGMAKLAASETAARIVDRGMRAMGALGLSVEERMQMYFRDARLALFSPVSNDMVRNVLGEDLGLPRSYGR